MLGSKFFTFFVHIVLYLVNCLCVLFYVFFYTLVLLFLIISRYSVHTGLISLFSFPSLSKFRLPFDKFLYKFLTSSNIYFSGVLAHLAKHHWLMRHEKVQKNGKMSRCKSSSCKDAILSSLLRTSL